MYRLLDVNFFEFKPIEREVRKQRLVTKKNTVWNGAAYLRSPRAVSSLENVRYRDARILFCQLSEISDERYTWFVIIYLYRDPEAAEHETSTRAIVAESVGSHSSVSVMEGRRFPTNFAIFRMVYVRYTNLNCALKFCRIVEGNKILEI